MRCSRISESLSRYLSQELDPREMAMVDSHLNECSRCRSELAKMSRAIRALEMPVRQFEAPDMLGEIKRRATLPDRVIPRVFPTRAAAAVALMALIAISAALLPRFARESRKPDMTYKPKVIASPPIRMSKRPEVTTVVRNVNQARHPIHKRPRTARKSINRIVCINKAECSARVTIMDPAQFEASRVRLSAQATVIMSDNQDSGPVIARQTAPPVAANRPYELVYREPTLRYARLYGHEEDRNELP